MVEIINGVRYNVHIEGNGQPVVLLHGFTGSAMNWEPFFALFKDQFKVIAIDLLGHGKTESPRDASRYTMEETVEDLAELFSRLRIEKAILLGYSMGGRVALSFASTYPEQVEAMILESSSPGLQQEEERQQRRKNDAALAQFIEDQGIESFVQRWEDISLFESQKSLPENRKHEIRKQRLTNSSIGLANSLRGMGTGSQPSWWDELHNLDFPILLLVGDKDLKFCKIAEKMHETLPQSKKIKINDAGHTIHVEQPQIFGKIVLDFVVDLH